MPTPTEIVERLISLAGDDERALEHFAPDAEVHPLTGPPTLHGLEEIRRHAADTAATRPSLRGCIVHELGDKAVVLTTLAFQRERAGGESFTEVRPVGFILEVRDGKVVRLAHYETWSAAREAAGIDPESQGKRVMPQGLLAVAVDLASALAGARLPRGAAPPRTAPAGS